MEENKTNKSTKVLVVDDSNLDRLQVIQAIRESRLSCEILEANNGEDALAVLAKNYKEVALILLDWQMPVMDGIEFMTAAVEVPQTASIPIVMVTASGSQDAQRCARFINPNLAGYVVKPYEPNDLLDVITPYLNTGFKTPNPTTE